MTASAPAMRRVPLAWSIIATSIPMFLVALNNLVVTNALPQIQEEFSASQQDLQWVINSYVLAFAGLLLTGAGLGDRYGRKKVFLGGLAIFAAGSVLCALAGSFPALLIGRVIQGVGAAAVLPLSLTLLSAAVPEKMRSAAIGIWSGINGLGVAIGPLLGGAVTDGLAWEWIFWINIPVAVIAAPLVLWAIDESVGPDRELDLIGMVTVSAAVTALVWGIVRGGTESWTDAWVLGSFIAAAALLVAFVLWERRAPYPLLPLRFYRIPTFVLSNIVSLCMYFGVFGSIFFLAQYLQGPLGFSASEAGLRTLPWTAMPMLIAPIAGALTDRVGGGRFMAAGLGIQGIALAWIAIVAQSDTPYTELVPPMVLGGIGMGLVFAPTAAVVLASVREHEHGKASGANNTVREIGGALGVAILTTVFQRYADTVVVHSSEDAAEPFITGMRAAIWVGVAVVVAGALCGAAIKKNSRPQVVAPQDDVSDHEPLGDGVTAQQTGDPVQAAD